jgi:ADP-heptose:LPS heptosyltransferase
VQLDLVGRTDLLTLAAVLERAQVVVTGDTGPMHLAVAMGTRVLALFGPADPSRTGPYGQLSSVLRAPPWDGVREPDAAMRDLAPEVVVRALVAALGSK